MAQQLEQTAGTLEALGGVGGHTVGALGGCTRWGGTRWGAARWGGQWRR